MGNYYITHFIDDYGEDYYVVREVGRSTALFLTDYDVIDIYNKYVEAKKAAGQPYYRLVKTTDEKSDADD